MSKSHSRSGRLTRLRGRPNNLRQYISSVPLRLTPAGALVPPDKTTKYYVIWYLKNDQLFMSDIYFLIPDVQELKSIFPNNEQYKVMEKLTGVQFDTKFERYADINLKELTHPVGVMPAIWVNDTIVIKPAAKYGGDYDQWEKSPCRELIFQNGKLISTKEKTDSD